MTIAIEVADVSKRFTKHSEPAKTLKERLLTWRSSTTEQFHALREIDFAVDVGETFGILGHNGSGKSTLLKCIAGTIQPTRGVVRVRGRLSALLELGAGFHPDLTGRENIFLNGSILGFSKVRIESIFDEIVEFSGLEEFIDTQVKHYSSGMYARLGFAVAVNLQPDVLLIDEVLAVGDEAFQRKCIERVRGFQREGRTICLVTHSPELVRSLCDRAMVLDHGHLLHVGDVGQAVTTYRRSLDPNFEAEPEADGNGGVSARSNRVHTTPPAGEGSTGPHRRTRIEESWIEPPPDGVAHYRPGDRVVIGMRFSAPDGELVRGRLSLHSNDGVHLINVSTWDISGADLGPTTAHNEIRFVLHDLPLMDGHYLVTLILQDQHETVEFDRQEEKLAFDVNSGGPVLGRVVMQFSLETSTDQPA
jgi:ABC-2 type transport system ATP-binding protein